MDPQKRISKWGDFERAKMGHQKGPQNRPSKSPKMRVSESQGRLFEGPNGGILRGEASKRGNEVKIL